jgi:hypothetical protein
MVLAHFKPSPSLRRADASIAIPEPCVLFSGSSQIFNARRARNNLDRTVFTGIRSNCAISE